MKQADCNCVRFVGYSGLLRQTQVLRQDLIEIAFGLLPAFWGHGYATEAAVAVRDYAFGVLQLSRVVSLIRPENEPAIALAQRLGMQHEAGIYERAGLVHHVYGLSVQRVTVV